MPLNYSKWDQLELSDDSDIEGHPNVDKKSLIRWKQRDIHEKREQRNHRITEIDAEISCNNVLLDRLRTLKSSISESGGASRFSSEVERLRTSPSPDAPPTNAPNQVTYDAMMLQLLEPLAVEAREKAAGDQDKLVKLLEEKLEFHVVKLGEVTEERRKKMEELLKEKAKHITTEDIHEAWESKYTPTPSTSTPEKSTSSTTSTAIEVLNPGASSSQPPKSKSISTSEDLDDLPEMTPSLEGFSKLPLWDFEASQTYIQSHRDVVAPGSSDALLVAAFTAETEGKSKYSKQCVHQSLLLQYGDKLGKDGLRLFFKRMIEGGQKAHAIFRKDVEDTYTHISNRVATQKLESPALPSSGESEQIQLVAENPETTISFNVPDGPPPENIVLEGPGTEDLDIEEVRKALQLRWDLFQGLSAELQEALRTGELESVNKVLGNMGVAQAEQEVKMMDMGGILNFAGEGIRDMTGEVGDDDDDEEDEGEEEEAEEKEEAGEEVKTAA